MSPQPERLLSLYTRDDCEPCHDARAAVQQVLEARILAGRPAPALRIVDVSGDPALESRFGAAVPVLTLGDERLDLAVSPRRIDGFLDRALGTLA